MSETPIEVPLNPVDANDKAIENLRDNVDRLTVNGRTIYLVGTAHVSKKSADLAEEIIREVAPDSVAVELCESRYVSLRDPDRWRNTDIVGVLRQGKSYVLMAQLLLVGFQRKIGNSLDIKPGAEMLRAIEVADELQANTVLADREIRVTLKRTWASLGLISMGKVLGSLIFGLFGKHEISEEEIERLKSSVALDEMMRELSDAIPEVKGALIDERDRYLAEKIQSAPGNSVVAIIGAGHIPGIKRYIGTEIDLSQLEEIPPPRAWVKVIAWAIPLLILGMLVYGFFKAGGATSMQMLGAWIAANSIFAGLGAMIALPHPITVITAAVVAPFTSLNPFIAAGWVAGLVEAMLRKPRVADLESIADDMGSVKGIWSNRLSKVLLVMALTNLGSMVGTAIGIPWVASFLK